MFKTILLTLICSFCFVSNSFALVYDIKDFSNELRAIQYAKEVNGQVFKEQGENLWRVIYGNNPINDVVIVTFISEDK